MTEGDIDFATKETPMMTSATAAKGAAALRRVDTQLLLRLWRFSSADAKEDGSGRRVVSSVGIASGIASGIVSGMASYVA